ncbi:hypothetical protein BG006_010666 [Podila minutissima]|uniref:Uncharacterized protein n=1 Tax=Podila minutissima TaxID=64525 RepID=A0A9P5VPS2_9FUNG|nr:hypothetical protein BG006_010666 [Podila minutissima]
MTPLHSHINASTGSNQDEQRLLNESLRSLLIRLDETESDIQEANENLESIRDTFKHTHDNLRDARKVLKEYQQLIKQGDHPTETATTAATTTTTVPAADVEQELARTKEELIKAQALNKDLEAANENLRKAAKTLLPRSDKLREVFRIYKLAYPQVVMFKRREYYILSRMKNSMRSAESRFLTKFRQDDQPSILHEFTNVPNGTYLSHNLREKLKGKILFDNNYFALEGGYTESQMLEDIEAIYNNEL